MFLYTLLLSVSSESQLCLTLCFMKCGDGQTPQLCWSMPPPPSVLFTGGAVFLIVPLSHPACLDHQHLIEGHLTSQRYPANADSAQFANKS